MVISKIILQTRKPFLFFCNNSRLLCTTITSNNVKESKNIKRSVYVSKSNNIFTNLALEDWIYKNVDCSNHHILMLWCNNPCVVIGRFQNPWLEANVAELKYVTENGVHFARRNSGGGTVYHDRGNLNLTFFTSRDKYNRKENLRFIQEVVKEECGVEIEISKREDLMIGDCKISGTASKLGRLSSYHHCTLLVNANKQNLSAALKKQESDIKTNATQSIKSKIMNLQDKNLNITVDNLLEAIGMHYLNKGVEQRTNNLIKNPKISTDHFKVINPTNEDFPGLDEIRNGLFSWDWRFGKTPKFTISRSFSIPNDFFGEQKHFDEKLTISILVENGLIEDVTLGVPLNIVGGGFDGSINVITNLKGQRFTEEALEYLKRSLEEDISLQADLKSKFLVDCFRKVVMNSS